MLSVVKARNIYIRKCRVQGSATPNGFVNKHKLPVNAMYSLMRKLLSVIGLTFRKVTEKKAHKVAEPMKLLQTGVTS